MPFKDLDERRTYQRQQMQKRREEKRLLLTNDPTLDPLLIIGERWTQKWLKKGEQLLANHSDEAIAARLERGRARVRRHREKNPELARARTAAYYQLHRDEECAKARARYEEIREAENARSRQYYAEHAEELAAKKRAYRSEHPEEMAARTAQYQQEHPEAIRLYSARRRARKLALPDTFTAAERQFMLDYWHHACAVCGNQEGFFWTLADDHWVCITSPVCPGTVAENMIPLCHGRGGCNNSKHDADPQDWLISRVGPVKAKRILKAITTYFATVQARKASAAAD
jgi:hypothetical protein